VCRWKDREVRLIACPVGIDAREFAQLASSERAKDTFARLKASAVGRALIVGVDRLDYSKGLEERFLGYERFLNEHPEERKEVVLLQIAPPHAGRWRSISGSVVRWKGWPGGSTGPMPGWTGCRSATSIRPIRAMLWPGSIAPAGSGWSRPCATA
jgi:trehalose 6-phosphate synthase